MRLLLAIVYCLLSIGYSQAQPFTVGELAWPDTAWPRDGGSSPGGGTGDPSFADCSQGFYGRFYSSNTNLVHRDAVTSASCSFTNDGTNETFTFSSSDSLVVFRGFGTAPSVEVAPHAYVSISGSTNDYYLFNSTPVNPLSGPQTNWNSWIFTRGTLNASGHFYWPSGGGVSYYRIDVSADWSDGTTGGGSAALGSLTLPAGGNGTFSFNYTTPTNCYWEIVAGVSRSTSPTNVFTPLSSMPANSGYIFSGTSTP